MLLRLRGSTGDYQEICLPCLAVPFRPDSDDPDIVGGHANFFTLDCGAGPCPSVGRYDDGIHIECATGGCGPGDPLVVHDDTISPWTGDFTFGAVLTGNFWEHGFVDLVGGTICNCVFPQ